MARFSGDDYSLLHGIAHMVWSNENFDDRAINYCLNQPDDPGVSEANNAVVRESLRALLAVPEEFRKIPFSDWSMHSDPADHPPPSHWEMVPSP